MQTVQLRIPNSLLLVTTAADAELPESIGPGELVAATATCLAVGTMAEDDGEVSVTVADGPADGHDALSVVGEWVMDVPAGQIRIETVLGAQVLAWPAPGPRSLIRVWVSDEAEPDRVLIEVLPA
jgi:hypothetical protein